MRFLLLIILALFVFLPLAGSKGGSLILAVLGAFGFVLVCAFCWGWFRGWLGGSAESASVPAGPHAGQGNDLETDGTARSTQRTAPTATTQQVLGRIEAYKAARAKERLGQSQ